jgi:hypothetical protein
LASGHSESAEGELAPNTQSSGVKKDEVKAKGTFRRGNDYLTQQFLQSNRLLFLHFRAYEYWPLPSVPICEAAMGDNAGVHSLVHRLSAHHLGYDRLELEPKMLSTTTLGTGHAGTEYFHHDTSAPYVYVYEYVAYVLRRVRTVAGQKCLHIDEIMMSSGPVAGAGLQEGSAYLYDPPLIRGRRRVL